MGITVFINHVSEIDEWINRHPAFLFLKRCDIPMIDKYRWNTDDNFGGYQGKTIYSLQIMFIGKTGYGKSTTLNELVGKDVFETNDVSVCTKDLYTAMYRINNNIPSFLMISDLPGIGESNYADQHYFDWYKVMIEKSNVVVYVLRADQRDFAVDEQIIDSLFSTSKNKMKLLIAINYADKIEPVNRKSGLSYSQLENLEKRVADVSTKFNISKDNILYYSATDQINIDVLEKKMAEKLKNNI